jgi:hypothetical protein
MIVLAISWTPAVTECRKLGTETSPQPFWRFRKSVNRFRKRQATQIRVFVVTIESLQCYKQQLFNAAANQKYQYIINVKWTNFLDHLRLLKALCPSHRLISSDLQYTFKYPVINIYVFAKMCTSEVGTVCFRGINDHGDNEIKSSQLFSIYGMEMFTCCITYCVNFFYLLNVLFILKNWEWGVHVLVNKISSVFDHTRRKGGLKFRVIISS